MHVDIATIKARANIVTATRNFFLGANYLELATPILSPHLIPESCLEVFKTEFVHPRLTQRDFFLTPSPEVYMKEIIAETGQSVFQISQCFRNAESIGKIHNPEFTMLEYYTVGATSKDNIEITEELFRACKQSYTPESAQAPFARITMTESFWEYCKLDLDKLQARENIIDAARKLNLHISENATWEEAFNVIFLSCVEEKLPRDRPLVLDEYPEQINCLAKKIPGRPVRERWELYVHGIEVANCYSEERDPQIIADYFTNEGNNKKNALVPHAINLVYADIFKNFPQCSGVAIGFDRFLMSLLDKKTIHEVMLFPFK